MLELIIKQFAFSGPTKRVEHIVHKSSSMFTCLDKCCDSSSTPRATIREVYSTGGGAWLSAVGCDRLVSFGWLAGWLAGFYGMTLHRCITAPAQVKWVSSYFNPAVKLQELALFSDGGHHNGGEDKHPEPVFLVLKMPSHLHSVNPHVSHLLFPLKITQNQTLSRLDKVTIEIGQILKLQVANTKELPD